MNSLQREIALQNCVGNICTSLTSSASEATIAKMDGVYVHIKLQKNDKSFGYMYTLLEDLKSKYPIKEYSCNQSTLEQVFNAFATQDAYANINKRLVQHDSGVNTNQLI